MKKEIGKYIAIFLGIVCIILAIALFYIKISSVNAQTADNDLREKIEEEISFLDSNITDVMNKINNITVIKYKVYTRKINDINNSSSQNSSGSSSEESQGGSQSQSGQEGGQGGSSSSQGKEQGSSNQSSSQGQGESQTQNNSTTVSELVPDTTLENNNQETDWKENIFNLANNKFRFSKTRN